MTSSRTGCLPLVLVLAACCACGRPPPAAKAPAAPPASPADLASLPSVALKSLCPADGDSYFKARIRGALDADIDWKANVLSCDGGARPSGSGLRAALAGPLVSDGKPLRRLRFIFGVNLTDRAAGSAVALPTNLTVILEGESTLFATLGEDRCASEIVSRRKLVAAGEPVERLEVRGYCTQPAIEARGDRQILVSTFEFASLIHIEGS